MTIKPLILLLVVSLIGGVSCSISTKNNSKESVNNSILPPPDPTLIVDCQLPARIKRLGPSSTYMGSRRALKTSSQDCEIRGGEYVAYDRANFKSSFNVWLPLAESGDPLAQHNLATIFTKNLDVTADYNQAVFWFEKAAKQNHSPAQYSLAYLYEHGLGVRQNPELARYWYQKAAGLPVEIPKSRGFQSETQSQINIKIIEPHLPPTRGSNAPPIILSHVNSSIENISAVVNSARPLSLVSVNNISIKTNSAGEFSTTIRIPSTGTLVDIVAVDDIGFSSLQQLVFSFGGDTLPSIVESNTIKFDNSSQSGDFYALVIGNSNYQRFPKLKTPKNDVRALKRLLRNKYGFTQVRTLFNANRYQIITALNALRYELNEDDNLLIYYAGHGELDSINKRSQWLPVDAEPNNTANWISDSALSELVNVIQAKHVMIIADSCYAGMMTRSAFDNVLVNSNSDKTIENLFNTKKSRTVLSSGGVAPVLDVGGGKHSLFAAALLSALENNNGRISGQDLYRQVTASVSVNAATLNIEQIPQYAPIEFASHEAGDFMFIVK